MGYRLSPPARNDIDEIWDFIAQDNPEAAERFTAMLTGKFHAIAAEPHMGRACSKLGAGLRRFPVGNYVNFYRPTESHVEIARVLHGARDIEALFDSGDETQ
jgi:toxin ParE1/3/4